MSRPLRLIVGALLSLGPGIVLLAIALSEVSG